MELRLVLLSLFVCGVVGEVDHAELRGEHPSQEDVDNGQCIPMPCDFGKPVPECKRLCDSRNYETICQPPADLCLCRHMVDGKPKLVSPDEIQFEPSSSEDDKKPQEADHEASKVEPEKPSEEPQQTDEGYVSFHIFAVFLPIKQFIYESINEEPTPEPTASLGYEPVNVHEGRLFWDFRYILTGLLLLMIGLVLYELVLCATQLYGPKHDTSVKCDAPDVKVLPVPIENKKILNV